MFSFIRLALPLVLAACILGPALAQDAPAEAPKAVTATDPAIQPAELKILLKPLFREDLEIEAKEWLALLKQKSDGLTQLRLKRVKAEEGAKAAMDEEIFKEETSLGELGDRVKVVLAGLEEKGGDVTDARKYTAAVLGTETDLTDTTSALTYAKNWVVSPRGGILWGLNILKFLGYLIAFWILAAILGAITRKAVAPLKKSSALLKDFFVNSVRKVTMLVGLVMALGALGVDIGPLIAAMGVAGFVVGFALQGTLSNFASGIMILLYRPYDVGDVVTVSGITGKVHAMSLVSTTVLTPDNQIVVIPNGSIWGGIITNITGNETRRVDLVFGISYSDDLAKAEGILKEILESHPLVLKDPAPTVKLHELADSSVNFVVRPWSKTSDYWDVYWDVTRAVKERFDAESVSIPFPQRDIHVHQAPIAPATPPVAL